MPPDRIKSVVAYDKLLGEIRSGRYAAGETVMPLRELCRRLDLTAFAARKALGRLEDEGYIERRHGSGTFIKDLRPAASLEDAVAVCMDLRGHLFDELSRKLIVRLQASRRLVLPVDISLDSGGGMLLSAIRAKPGVVVLQGNISLPREVVDQAPADVAIVMLFHQITRLERQADWRVEIDHRRGGQIAAETLWSEGHRRVLAVGSAKSVGTIPVDASDVTVWPGPAFIRHWQSLGGEVAFLSCDPDPQRRGHLTLDYNAVKAALSTQQAKTTAVFASRDVDVFDLQSLLAEREPAMLHDLRWFGYGDTPWRLLSPAPIGSINFRLDHVAECIYRLTTRSRAELDGGMDLVIPALATQPENALLGRDSGWLCDIPALPSDTHRVHG